MFGRYVFPWQSLSLLLVNSLLSSADQVVYLERLGLPNGDVNVIDEPLFNPKTINASVGEKIHFQARFSDVSSAPVTYMRRMFLTSREVTLIRFFGPLVNLSTLHPVHLLLAVASQSMQN